MKRHQHGTNSCDRVISFNYPACVNVLQDDSSLQHLSAEETTCLTILDELMSAGTDDGDHCSDAQSSGDVISKNHQVTTCGVDQDRSSCTGSSHDLSEEEKASLKFLEETIDSIEIGEMSTDNAESAQESSYTVKRQHINQMKFFVPTAFALATRNGSTSPKRGTAPLKEKPPPFKDHGIQNDQQSTDASHWGSLSHDGLMGLCKRVSMIKTSHEKLTSTHGDCMDSNKPQNILENRCSKPNPPPVAPKSRLTPSHIASLKSKGTIIFNPNSNLHRLSPSPKNCSVMKPDKNKLEALSKLSLLKENVTTDKKQTLYSPMSPSSFPDWSQDKLEKSGMKLESSVSKEEQLALQKLAHDLGLSLPKIPDVDEDRQWAQRKLDLLKD